MSIEQQIEASSVIALARFEEAPDGEMKAVIEEVLKKTPGTTFRYDVGDEYPQASRYPRDGTDYGDGIVIFFTGSPATMSMLTTISDDRISGLGDIPVQLFKQKCASPRA